MSTDFSDIKNPAIRKLAEECQTYHTGDFGMRVYGGVDLERFATRVIEEYTKEIRRNATPPNLPAAPTRAPNQITGW